MHRVETSPAAQILPQLLAHRQAALIQTDPIGVYQAITTDDGLLVWFTTCARVDARLGGVIFFRWNNWDPDRITANDGSRSRMPSLAHVLSSSGTLTTETTPPCSRPTSAQPTVVQLLAFMNKVLQLVHPGS